jgi:RNA polymerase subunit RPABC4/transcription elongation factor Spt4
VTDRWICQRCFTSAETTDAACPNCGLAREAEPPAAGELTRTGDAAPKRRFESLSVDEVRRRRRLRQQAIHDERAARGDTGMVTHWSGCVIYLVIVVGAVVGFIALAYFLITKVF